MGRAKKAKKVLLNVFAATSSPSVSLSKKELFKRAKASATCDTDISKKHIEKALVKLVKQGTVKKLQEDQFSLYESNPNTDDNNDSSSTTDGRNTITLTTKTTTNNGAPSNSDSQEENTTRLLEGLPFAEVQRRKRAAMQKEKESSSTTPALPIESEKHHDNGLDGALPFAEILRRRSKQENISEAREPFAVSSTQKAEQNNTPVMATDTNNNDDVDTDEEIRRLEAELANNDDDSDEDESDSDEMDDDNSASGKYDEVETTTHKRKKTISFGETTTVEIPSTSRRATRGDPADGPEVLCLSTLADERITPLPSSYLPTITKRKLKGIDDDGRKNKKSKKAKAAEAATNSGLQAAVKEVLDGYVARSSERLPFYCRVCATQLSNETEFRDHKQTEFHKTAVNMERKASYCKLCRKQFTSPVQLKEHVTSKPHRERLHTLQSRQNHGSVHNRHPRQTPYNRQAAQRPPFRRGRGGGGGDGQSFGQRTSAR